jgi:cell fate (sporulation/competence/biofilm development) regulator YlbF (YheA/YmcA/DUF963 family)
LVFFVPNSKPEIQGKIMLSRIFRLCYNKGIGGGSALDMSQILLDAYQLADEVNKCEEVETYLKYKQAVTRDPDAQRLINEFQKVKELYAEAQRFGIFHPNYHEAKAQVVDFSEKMRTHPTIGAYLAAEERLDQLLHQISVALAHSVSESIKIPSNELNNRSKTKRSCQL